MKNKEELNTIFKGIVKKEEKYFNMFYEKYNKLVYAISFSILKNKENTEDVVQTVFAKIWDMDTEKLPKENEMSWLYTLTKNETLNYLRKQKETLNIEDVYYITEESEELNKIIDKDTFNNKIRKLDRKEQEIVSLRILSNLSFKEISKILNMPIGTVEWKYYKSMNTLKMLLTNLSMFIISIFALIIERKVRIDSNKKAEEEKEIQITDSIEKIPPEHIKESDEEIYDSELTKKDMENISEDNMMYDEEFIYNEKIKAEQEGIIIDENTVENVKLYNKLTLGDIGILSIAGVFLIITLIFLVNFIKHQQNKKKNVSK